MTSLGLSPTLARALLPHGDRRDDLSSLRTFLTTGEPWNPEPYRWLVRDVGGARVPDHQLLAAAPRSARASSRRAVRADQGCSLGVPVLGDGDGRRRRRRRAVARARSASSSAAGRSPA